MKIMIIEDDVALCSLYTDIITEEHELHVFTNPKKALEFYSTDPNFDLIIADHHLPMKSGESVVFDIKYMNPDQKILLVSGWMNEVNFPEKFQITKLAKPFTANLFNVAFLNALKSKE